jgi:hypothetical protein
VLPQYLNIEPFLISMLAQLKTAFYLQRVDVHVSFAQCCTSWVKAKSGIV